MALPEMQLETALRSQTNNQSRQGIDSYQHKTKHKLEQKTHEAVV